MATPALRRQVLEALQAAVGSEDVPGTAAKSLDTETRDWIVLDYVTAVHSRAGEFAVDPRQEWLDLGLPRFSYVQIRKGDSLEDYRGRTRTLARRIKSYDYKRRNSEKLARDKKELRQRKMLEPKIAPFFVGDDSMTADRAVELLAVNLKSAATEQRRRASKGGVRARMARTKNQ